MSKIVDKFKERDLKKRLVDDMGFSDKKSAVYLSVLKLGEATSNDIAKNAGIKRTTVYNILPELLKDGVIHKSKRLKKTLFYVEDPSDLIARIDEKKFGIEEIIPSLSSLQMTNKSNPKIVQYEGQNGIIQLYKDMLDSIPVGGELLSIIGANYAKELMPYHILEYYSDFRLKKKISHKIIGTNNDFIQSFKAKDKDEYRETRILEEGNELIGSDIRIFGNKIAMLSFKEGFIGVIIESEDLNKLNKILFERVWKSLETKNQP